MQKEDYYVEIEGEDFKEQKEGNEEHEESERIEKTLSQEEFLTIEKIANRFCNKTFSYHEKDDIKQEVWVICLEAISKFNANKSTATLETFLFSVVKNELATAYNKLFKRVSPPLKCRSCDEACKSQCKSWANYKKNLSRIKELQIVTLGIDKSGE